MIVGYLCNLSYSVRVDTGPCMVFCPPDFYKDVIIPLDDEGSVEACIWSIPVFPLVALDLSLCLVNGLHLDPHETYRFLEV